MPACHSLHFLQMATEQLAKAYRFRDTSADVAALLTSHVGFPRFLNAQLAPAVDRESVPGNTEYPWERGEGVVAPIDHRFPEVALLRHPRGRMFLNFIRRAFDEFPAA